MTNPNETNAGFRNDYFFLSNFSSSPITINYHGHEFTMATGEHVFQAMKIAYCPWHEEVIIKWLTALSNNQDPLYSKKMGRTIKTDVKKWDAYSTMMMKRTQELKYQQNSALKDKLVGTGDLILVEYNTWGDKLWGVDSRDGEGDNKLGKILMELRTQFQQ